MNLRRPTISNSLIDRIVQANIDGSIVSEPGDFWARDRGAGHLPFVIYARFSASCYHSAGNSHGFCDRFGYQ